MKLPRRSVDKPVMTMMVFLAILIIGVIALTQIKIDVMPEIEVPTMGVITSYPGASSKDMENLVTKVLESNLAAISHVKDINSNSTEDYSSILISFEWGTNLDEAANDIRQAIDFAEEALPEDSEDPMLIKFDLSMMPVMWIGITADQSYNELYNIVDKRICDPLMRLPGVALAEAVGGEIREIKVTVDQSELEAYQISEESIASVLAAENISRPAGKIEMGRKAYIIRVPGEYTSVDQIAKTVVAVRDGQPVHLRDIAEVVDGYKEKDRRVRVNGESAVLVLAMKQSDENTVEVAESIREELPSLVRNLPSDANLNIIMDSSEFIRDSVNNLRNTVLWAILFVVIVVFLFLREWRGSFIVGVTIPFSMVLAFIFLYLAGYTINTMSLSAVAIAIGMVVDNAIVIFENIYYHRKDIGESPNESAVFGSSEVGLAVTASTATTVSIFIPVIFIPGITGIIFKELAFSIIVVLVGSLFCALSLTPMLSSRLLRQVDRRRETALQRYGNQVFGRIEDFYSGILAWALDHRKTIIFSGLGIFLSSLLLTGLIGTEFFPSVDQGEVRGNVELAVGTRVEVTDSVMTRVEKILQEKVPEADIIFARCGTSESGWSAMVGREEDTHIINIGGMLIDKNDRERSDADIGKMLSREIKKIPGVVSVDFTPTDMFAAMMSGGTKPVSIEIYSDDYQASGEFAVKLLEEVKEVEGIIDPSISRKPGKPELWVEVDRDRAAILGLSMAHISNTVRNNFQGKIAMLYRERDDEFDTRIRLSREERRDIDNLLRTTVISPVTGQKVPLANIAHIRNEQGVRTLERKNQQRIVFLNAGIYGRPLGNVVEDIREKIGGMDVPENIDLHFGGTAEDQAESFKYLFLALILGITLVYMVMASQFESLLDPFIIMFSVPFAITGVILALLITGNTLNLVSYVGMIMLVGIVVNNGIVLVDYTNILRAREYGIREAILTAGQRRLRPVLMTAFTTIFALTPLALSTGEGAESWSPLAISVIGGLLFSALVTLIFVPTMYSILEERIRKNRKKNNSAM
ncbi:MAG: MMPL family transporter [Candidatus Latescibacteria bacterium]|nr:MMPL family transporter [bacterium]MBD3425068.1 MMPL family transporter [Candidatus Latescibacterota bacterium]